MLNSSKIFSYVTIYSNFMLLDELFFSYLAYRHKDRQTHTDTQTHTDEYSLVAVDKPQL